MLFSLNFIPGDPARGLRTVIDALSALRSMGWTRVVDSKGASVFSRWCSTGQKTERFGDWRHSRASGGEIDKQGAVVARPCSLAIRYETCCSGPGALPPVEVAATSGTTPPSLPDVGRGRQPRHAPSYRRRQAGGLKPIRVKRRLSLDDFASIGSRQTAPHPQIDAVDDESNRSVAHHDLYSPGMLAA